MLLSFTGMSFPMSAPVALPANEGWRGNEGTPFLPPKIEW